jgi:uncharacterized protein with PhoU and TrkA domain
MTHAEERTVGTIFDKKAPFTRDDIQFIRQHAEEVRDLSSRLDQVAFRTQIELIDAIRALNTSTTRLMWVAIAVAVVGVLVSSAQIISTVLLRR